MKKFDELIIRSKNTATKKEIEILVDEISIIISENKKEAALLHARADLYCKLQQYGKAINDFRSILSLNEKDKKAKGQLEMLINILKFTGNDIYANPNTNLDPWLE